MQAIDGAAAGKAAGRTFAGFVPDRSVLRRRAEVAVCGQPFSQLREPVTVEMIVERDAFVVAFLRICRPTPTIVRSGTEFAKERHDKAKAKAAHKDAK